MIVLNLKTYEQSFERVIELCEAANDVSEESGVRIISCVPNLLLKECTKEYGNIFAQHTDGNGFGAFTGSIPANALKKINAKGSLVNHSEKRIPFENIQSTVSELNKMELESIVCAENPEEVKKIAQLKPNFIAIEPKELIGSGISVSDARPEIITDSLKVLQEINSEVSLLCGAGVTKKEDVKKSFELGAKGVLLASAFVKAEDPKKFLEEFVSVY